MSAYVTVEELDKELADEVYQVFTSNGDPFKSARNFYKEKREEWRGAVDRFMGVTIKVGGFFGATKLKGISPLNVVEIVSGIISYDTGLMEMVKNDKLEDYGIDNLKLSRIFVIHIVAGEPYWPK